MRTPAEQSAYEFPTGDRDARVVVRKLIGKPEWLIAAWAAGGADRQVSVRIPELGRVAVQARICGSVYRASLAKGQVTLTQLDPEGFTCTTVAPGKPLLKPVDLVVAKPPSTGLLLWLAADTGVTKEADGTVTSWTSQGTPKLVFTQADAKRRPTWIAQGVRGKPALRFAPDQQWLGLTGLDAKVGAKLVGPYTVVAVFADASPKNNRILSALTSTGGHDYETGLCFTDDQASLMPAGATDGVLLKVASGQVKGPLATICVGAMCYGAESMGGNGFGFGGTIAEIIVYAGALSQADTVPLLEYLADTYRERKP